MMTDVWIVERTWYEYGTDCNFNRFKLFATEEKAQAYVADHHTAREALNEHNNTFLLPDNDEEFNIIIHVYKRNVA